MGSLKNIGPFHVYDDELLKDRVIVLPCKFGTHLWCITYPYRKEPKVTEYVVKNFRTITKKHKFQIEVQALNVPVTNWMYYDDFFTTYEEAQAELEKLKKAEEECNVF